MNDRKRRATPRRSQMSHRCTTLVQPRILSTCPTSRRHCRLYRQSARSPRSLGDRIDHRLVDWGVEPIGLLCGAIQAHHHRRPYRRRAGVFQDAPRIERLDVTFASRYFEALNGYFHPGKFPKPTRSWQVTLNAASRAEPIILQHMLAGVNVHIGLDLGIAAQSIGAGGQLPAGTVNLRSCGRSANHIRLIRHTRPGESRRRNGENRPRIAQVDSAPSRHPRGQDRAVPGPGRSLWRLPLYRS